MAYYEKRDCHLCVSVGHAPPTKVLEHAPVLVLSSTVVSVQIHRILPEAVMIEVVVKLTYYYVRSLSTIQRFVSKKVNLAGDGLAVHTKDGTPTWCQEKDRARLLWI